MSAIEFAKVVIKKKKKKWYEKSLQKLLQETFEAMQTAQS